MIPYFKGLDKRRTVETRDLYSKTVQNGGSLNLSKTLVAKHEHPHSGGKRLQ